LERFANFRRYIKKAVYNDKLVVGIFSLDFVQFLFLLFLKFGGFFSIRAGSFDLPVVFSCDGICSQGYPKSLSAYIDNQMFEYLTL
jgi:hypothetical protein